MRVLRHERLALHLLVWLAGLAALTSCGPEWENDPDVQGARIACAGLRLGEHFSCVEREAVARLSPNVCRLAGIAIDDVCLRAVYETAGDPAICDQIYLRGVAPNCQAWYAGRTPQPGVLGERRRPQGDYLKGCSPETARMLAAFEEALASGERSFAGLCQKLGRPDWQTGSGLIIFVYELADGSEAWLGFGGLHQLNYVLVVAPGGERTDLLGK